MNDDDDDDDDSVIPFITTSDTGRCYNVDHTITCSVILVVGSSLPEKNRLGATKNSY
jgi:hypothetical protein